MPLILGTNSIKDTTYDVANSLRFDDGSNDYLNHTHNAVTSTRKQTFSVWVKRSHLTSYMFIISTKNGTSTDRDGIAFSGSDQIDIRYGAGSSSPIRLTTNRVFRDVSAWLHIVVAVDTTQASASNRIKLYVNGVQETSFATSNYMDQNYDFALNAKTDQATAIGVDGRIDGSSLFDGYMTEFVAIDGQQLAADQFGEFDSDSNIWKPIDVSGLTFGSSGFYLDFEDSSALGNDVSGNSNNFTVNNLTSVDQSTDTCTNNFATLNPLAIPTSGGANTFSNGNLEITNSADANRTSFSTIGVSSGKWYYECKVLSGEMKQFIGISKPQDSVDRIGNSANSYGYSTETARKYNNGSYSSYGSTASTGDIIMVAFDADNGAIWVGKNGTWFSSATQSEIEAGTTTNAMYSSITIDDFFVMGVSVEDSNVQMNFGSPMYSISSGNSDANGFGNFEYSVPSGYFSLCTKNLAEFG